jgi:hypothetical protein
MIPVLHSVINIGRIRLLKSFGTITTAVITAGLILECLSVCRQGKIKGTDIPANGRTVHIVKMESLYAFTLISGIPGKRTGSHRQQKGQQGQKRKLFHVFKFKNEPIAGPFLFRVSGPFQPAAPTVATAGAGFMHKEFIDSPFTFVDLRKPTHNDASPVEH